MTMELGNNLATLVFVAATGTTVASLTWLLLRQAESVSTAVVEWSLVRRENREKAIRNSRLFRLTLPLVRMCLPLTPRLIPESNRRKLSRNYAKAGYPGGYTDDELASVGVLLSIVLVLCFSYLGLIVAGLAGLIFGVGGIFLGPLLVSSSVESAANRRMLLIRLSLPYALDLLVLTLRSGTSLKNSLSRMVEDYARHPLGEEFGLMLAETQMGMARVDALKRLAERVDDEEMRTLVDSLNQAEELGWPLAETVERLSERMTQTRLLNAQEIAGAAGVKVMLPATLIMVAALLLLFGPTITRALRGEMSL